MTSFLHRLQRFMTEQSRFCTVHNRVRLTITSTWHALHTHWRLGERDWNRERERKMWHACSLILIQTSAAGPKLNFGLYILGCCSVKPQKITQKCNTADNGITCSCTVGNHSIPYEETKPMFRKILNTDISYSYSMKVFDSAHWLPCMLLWIKVSATWIGVIANVFQELKHSLMLKK